MDEDQVKQIKAIAEEVVTQKLLLARIQQAADSLKDKNSTLSFLLETAGYKPGSLEGIAEEIDGQVFISSEAISLVIDPSTNIPRLSKGQNRCDFDVTGNAEYYAQVAVVKDNKVKFYDILAKNDITRHLDKEVPADKLKEFSIKGIITQEGYRAFKGDNHLSVPAGNIMFVKDYKTSFSGSFNIVGDPEKSKRLCAKGQLNVSGTVLMGEGNEIYSVKLPSSVKVDTEYEVCPAELHSVKNSGSPNITPLPAKITLESKTSVKQNYLNKSNDMYRNWIIESVQNLPLDQETRSQLGLKLGTPNFEGIAAIDYLFEIATKKISTD